MLRKAQRGLLAMPRVPALGHSHATMVADLSADLHSFLALAALS